MNVSRKATLWQKPRKLLRQVLLKSLIFLAQKVGDELNPLMPKNYCIRNHSMNYIDTRHESNCHSPCPKISSQSRQVKRIQTLHMLVLNIQIKFNIIISFMTLQVTQHATNSTPTEDHRKKPTGSIETKHKGKHLLLYKMFAIMRENYSWC